MTCWPMHSIRSILASSLIFLIVVPGIGLGLFTLEKIETKLEADIIVSNHVLARSLAAQIDEILSRAEKIIIMTGNMAQETPFRQRKMDSVLATISGSFPAFSRLQILDHQGIVRHSSRRENAWTGYDLSKHPSYIRALNETDFCWSLSHIPIRGKTPSIVVSRRFNEQVVAGYLDLSQLSRSVGILASKTGVRAAILDRRATVVAGSEPEKAKQRVNLLNLPFIRQGLEGHFTSGRRHDEYGADAIVSMAAVRTGDLMAVIFRDAARALLPVTYIRRVMHVYRHIKAPLDALSRYTDRVADGRYDLPAKVGGLREFDHLTHNFVRMTRAVSARERALTDARRDAEAAARAKSAFLANMSHEIRTPLNAVTGFSELLSSLVRDEKQQSYLSAIKSAGKNLLMLINDILDLSKIEAGKLDIHPSRVDLKTILAEIRHIFALQASRKDIQFIIHIEESLPPALQLDEIRLRQILLNIVGNAIKFTETGRIELIVQTVVGNPDKNLLELHISIKDTGIGIPQDELDFIFDTFRQRTGQNNARYGGTGLGLAICKKLVEMMNGRIIVDSVEGKGSTFTIILHDVCACPDEMNVTEKNSSHENIRFEMSRVLVVDSDDASVYEKPQVSTLLSPEARSALPGLIERLESDVMEQWQALQKRQPLEQVKTFGETLRTLGMKHHLALLSDYGERLINDVENFDILDMRLTIPHFKKIINILKSACEQRSP
jgi:signal transduction histidine kinase